MRALKVLFWSLALAATSAAQAPPGGEAAPGVAVTGTGWVYVSNDIRQEAEAATMRGEQVVTGGGIAPTSVRTFPDLWEASVEIKNVGQRRVKSISLELVFTDAVSGRDFLRYRLGSNKGIAPGQVFTLRRRVNEPRKGYHRVAGTKRELIPAASAAARRVEVKRVEFADGTVWQP
jgi:hypothetical protein